MDRIVSCMFGCPRGVRAEKDPRKVAGGRYVGITEFENSLIELIRARNPLLYVETFEEARVVGAVENIATNPKLKRDRQVISYTLSSGLHRLGEQGKPTDPVAAINEAAKYQEPTVFVF